MSYSFIEDWVLDSELDVVSIVQHRKNSECCEEFLLMEHSEKLNSVSRS